MEEFALPNKGIESKPRWTFPFFTLTARKKRANVSSCLLTLFFLNVLLFVAFNCISYFEPFLKEKTRSHQRWLTALLLHSGSWGTFKTTLSSWSCHPIDTGMTLPQATPSGGHQRRETGELLLRQEKQSIADKETESYRYPLWNLHSYGREMTLKYWVTLVASIYHISKFTFSPIQPGFGCSNSLRVDLCLTPEAPGLQSRSLPRF